MATTSSFPNLSKRTRIWIMILLLTNILVILLLCGTLSILYVTSTAGRLLLIQLTEHTKSINVSVVRNEVYINKVEPQISPANLSILINSGKSVVPMIKSTVCHNSSSIQPLFTSLYDVRTLCQIHIKKFCRTFYHDAYVSLSEPLLCQPVSSYLGLYGMGIIRPPCISFHD